MYSPIPAHSGFKSLACVLQTLYSDEDGHPVHPCRAKTSKQKKTSSDHGFVEALLLNTVLDLLVPGKSVGSAESLVIVAKLTTSLLAVGVVDGILMASEIIGS